MSDRKKVKFRLYVADEAINSVLAIRNVTAMCRDHFPDRYLLEIVDVLREPERALADLIVMTPTLVKLAPAPIKRIVGTFADTSMVLLTLGLEDYSS